MEKACIGEFKIEEIISPEALVDVGISVDRSYLFGSHPFIRMECNRCDSKFNRW